MKRLLSIIVIAVLAIGVSSCVSDILSMFDKVSYTAYLNNETDETVYISFSSYGTEYSFEVQPNDVLEISDLDHWTLTQNPEDVGYVDFLFSEGSSTSHGCVRDETTGKHIFTPSENNIMDDNNWTVSQVKGRKYRRDYTIRKP